MCVYWVAKIKHNTVIIDLVAALWIYSDITAAIDDGSGVIRWRQTIDNGSRHSAAIGDGSRFDVLPYPLTSCACTTPLAEDYICDDSACECANRKAVTTQRIVFLAGISLIPAHIIRYGESNSVSFSLFFIQKF